MLILTSSPLCLHWPSFVKKKKEEVEIACEEQNCFAWLKVDVGLVPVIAVVWCIKRFLSVLILNNSILACCSTCSVLYMALQRPIVSRDWWRKLLRSTEIHPGRMSRLMQLMLTVGAKQVVNDSSMGFWKPAPDFCCMERVLYGAYSLWRLLAVTGCGWGWRESHASARSCEGGLPFTQPSLPPASLTHLAHGNSVASVPISGTFRQHAFEKSACFRDSHFGWGNSGVLGEGIPSPRSFAAFMVLALGRWYWRSRVFLMNDPRRSEACWMCACMYLHIYMEPKLHGKDHVKIKT